MKMRNPHIAANPKIHEIIPLAANPKFKVKPATRYVRNEMTATEIAYGSCVDT